jgi:hypothetical protein
MGASVLFDFTTLYAHVFLCRGGSVLDSVVGVFLTQAGGCPPACPSADPALPPALLSRCPLPAWKCCAVGCGQHCSGSTARAGSTVHRPTYPPLPLPACLPTTLLQNVADHLSSRAYMELASRFPAPRRRQMQAAAAAAAADGSQAAAGSGSSSSSSSSGDSGAAEEGGEASGNQGDGGWLSREDSVDWEAVRNASQEELSDAIKCRGMQNRCVGCVWRGQGSRCATLLRGKVGMSTHARCTVHGRPPCQQTAPEPHPQCPPCTGCALPYRPCTAPVPLHVPQAG